MGPGESSGSIEHAIRVFLLFLVLCVIALLLIGGAIGWLVARADDTPYPKLEGIRDYGCTTEAVEVVNGKTQEHWTEYRLEVWAEHEGQRDWKMNLSRRATRKECRKDCDKWLDGMDKLVGALSVKKPVEAHP